MAHTRERLIWVARKLASQGPLYLPRRLGYAARKRWVDRVFPTGWMARRAGIMPLERSVGVCLRDYMRGRPAPRWHWSAGDVPALVGAVPEARRARTIDQAEDVLRRRFALRGRDPITLPQGEWNPPNVSRGWTWDLNRHHWFATLGFAHLYSGDRRYVHAFVRESSDWMDQHLARLGGIEWDTPFEVASRISAWLWAHFLFLESPDWAPADHDRFVRGLGLLTEYLHQAIEYHSPGNHILLEAKALLLCSEVFPEFAGAVDWGRKGWRILRAELGKQICPDGVHAERSTMYHRIVAGELSELWLFCRKNELPPADTLREIVERMAEFQNWIDQGGGCLPLFADAHAEDTYYRFSAPAAVAAVDTAAARGLITESVDHSFWLLGVDETVPARPCRTAGAPAGRAFIDGGYFVARSAWTDADVLVWDCGPTGYRLNRKHAHLDALSFTLSVAGTPLLIDPGTDEVEDRKEPLRSTRAHTTVCVDGKEQGIPAKRGEIWSPPRAELLLWTTSEECTFMSGRHDGYRRLPDPVCHLRTIVAMHGLYWLVVDCLEGSGEHVAEQRFHVVPGAQVIAAAGEDAVEVTKEGATLSLRWAREGTWGAPTERKGGHPPPLIRIEPSLAELYSGRPEPSQVVTAERNGRVPFVLAVVLSPPVHGVRVSWAGGTEEADRWTVTGRGFEHQVYLARGTGVLPPLPGGWRTDARAAVCRAPAGGEARDLLLAGASRLWRDDRALLDKLGEAVSGGVMTRIMLNPGEDSQGESR